MGKVTRWCVRLFLVSCLAVLLAACGPSPVGPTAAAPTTPAPTTSMALTSLPKVVASTGPVATTAVPTTAPATLTPRATVSATASVPPAATSQPGAITPASAQDVVQLQIWGGGWVREILYAPDGRELALVTSLGLYIHDAGTLALLRSVQGEGWGYGVAFSPDWKTLAWASGSELLLLDASDGTLIRNLAGEPGQLGSPAFSPDGTLLAVIRFPTGEEVYTGAVELWRVADGTLLNRWECDGSRVAFAADGQSLATWYTMSGIRLWRVPGGSQVQHIEDWVDDVAFSPEGRFLAYGSMNTVKVWQVEGWSHAFDLKAALPDMRAIAFSPDGAHLAAVSGTGKGQVWQMPDGRVETRFGPESGISYGALAFAPDGQTLASAAMDVQFWRLPQGELAATMEGHLPPVRAVAISPDGATVAAVMEGSGVWLLDMATGSRRQLGEAGEALSLALAPDGRSLAVGLWDFSVRLLELPGGEPVRSMVGHPVQVQSVAFSPDGALLASSSMAEVRLWRAEDGSLLHALDVPRGGWIESAVFSPDGELVAALASDGKVWLWQVSSGERLATFQSPDDGYSGQVAFSPDGESVALAKHELVLVWEIGSGNLVESYEVAEGTAHLAFSPDGSLLANDAGHTLQLRERAGASLRHTLAGPSDVITGLAFSADGRFLVSASWDGTVRLWGLPGPTPKP